MCNFLLRDPLNRLWQAGVTDVGALTTSLAGFQSTVPQPPNLINGTSIWQLAATIQGSITATKLAVVPALVLPSIAMTSPGNVNWQLSITPLGALQTTSQAGIFSQDIIPYPVDVAMSRWPVSTGVFCPICNNASVTVSGDFSCWCCACSAFVHPEDTNILVILDE